MRGLAVTLVALAAFALGRALGRRPPTAWIDDTPDEDLELVTEGGLAWFRPYEGTGVRYRRSDEPDGWVTWTRDDDDPRSGLPLKESRWS